MDGEPTEGLDERQGLAAKAIAELTAVTKLPPEVHKRYLAS